jgi:predicted amidophosphoribosyltransferase
MVLIENLSFGAYLTYTPRGQSISAQQSKNLMLRVKNDNKIGTPPKLISEFIAEKIKENIENLPFKDFFGSDVALVPVPKSSLMQQGSLWVPDRIVSALEQQNLGKKYSCLRRVVAINKSATSSNADRPKAKDHFESVQCQVILPLPTKIILVDDVVTRGSTLLGCASRLKNIFPNTQIYAFAVIRTISDETQFEKIEDPCVGEIFLINNETYRTP